MKTVYMVYDSQLYRDGWETKHIDIPRHYYSNRDSASRYSHSINGLIIPMSKEEADEILSNY